MSAQPPYPAPAFEPALPPGLPPQAPPRLALARRHTVLFIVVFLILVGMAFFMPELFLLTGDRNPTPGHLWRAFKEGGFAMWLILLCKLFVWAALAGLGALLVRGTRTPAGILFILGLLPFGVGLLGAMAGAAKIAGAIAGESVDASMKSRIMANGFSELCNVFVYGGAVSGFALYLAAVAAVLGLVTIDPAPLGPRPRSLAWIVGLPVAFLFFVAAIAARAALDVGFYTLDALVLLGILTAGGWAALGGRAIPPLVAAGKEEEAGRAFRQLMVAAAALAAAMVLSDRAVLAGSIRKVFGAISDGYIDAAQKVTILRSGALPAMHGRPVVMVVDAIGCLAAFAPALLAARGVKGKLSITGFVAAGCAAITALLMNLSSSSFDHAAIALRAPYLTVDRALETNGVTLPTGRGGEGSGTETLPHKADLLVKKDGSPVDLHGPSDAENASRVEVAADASVPFSAFMTGTGASLLRGRASRRIAFTLQPAHRFDFEALGSLAGYLGTDLLSLPVTLHDKLAAGLPPPSSDGGRSYGSRGKGIGALAVLPDGDVGRLVAVVSSTVFFKLADTMPLADDSTSRDARRRIVKAVRTSRFDPDTILLAPAPGDTVGRIVAQLQAFAATWDRSGDRHDSDRTITDLCVTADLATLEAAPAAAEPTPTTPVVPTTRPTRRRPDR
jgi:hypothetical protein